MRNTHLTFLLSLSFLWTVTACSGFGEPELDCYSYIDCPSEQVCFSGTCVSETMCGEIPGLTRAIYDYEKSEDGIGEAAVDASGNEVLPLLCNDGEPLRCYGSQDYEVCAQRDYFAVGTGCRYYWPDTAVDGSGGWSWHRYQQASCSSGNVCVEGEAKAACVAACTSSGECGEGQSCQNAEGREAFLCGDTEPGPTIESQCTVTVVDAIVDGSGLEGADWTANAPDLYVVLESGEYRENTSVMEGTVRPMWNENLPELSYGQVSAMRIVLMEDDDAFLGVIPNFDDNVWQWTSEGGAWILTSMERSYDLTGGPVERLTMRVTCR